MFMTQLVCVYGNEVLQEQYKFVYDTLEEFVVCGTSHFHVQQLSDKLKQKSIKDKSSKKKMNEYEKEYAVSCLCPMLSRMGSSAPSPTSPSFLWF